MAYQNFIPTVWNEAIDRELERLCVFAEDCNRKYEGKVKEKGESVKILGVGKPTIKSIAYKDKNKNIDDAEEIEDTSIIMQINQIRYFNYKVGDIDKAQAVGGVMEALQAETSEGLANEVDTYIAGMANKEEAVKLYATAPKCVAGTASTGEINVLKALRDARKYLTKMMLNKTPKLSLQLTQTLKTCLLKLTQIRTQTTAITLKWCNRYVSQNAYQIFKQCCNRQIWQQLDYGKNTKSYCLC